MPWLCPGMFQALATPLTPIVQHHMSVMIWTCLKPSPLLMMTKFWDTDIIVEEIEAAFIALKCGHSKGTDGLNSECLIYGGDSLKL